MQEQGSPLGHTGAVVSSAAPAAVTSNATGPCHDLTSGKETSTAAGCVTSQAFASIGDGAKCLSMAQLLAPSYS